MMGQGGCLMMEDASVLAEVLREADSVESILHTHASRLGPAEKSRSFGQKLSTFTQSLHCSSHEH